MSSEKKTRCRKPMDPYTCLRCGYTTLLKTDMKRHLFKKKPCPSTRVDIQLTLEIKNHIVENRIYHLPKNEATTLNQTVNNYNTIMNFVQGLDPIHKVTYKNINIVPFDAYLDNIYEGTRRELENGLGSHVINSSDENR